MSPITTMYGVQFAETASESWPPCCHWFDIRASGQWAMTIWACSDWWMQLTVFAFICVVMGLSRYLWSPRIVIYSSACIVTTLFELNKPLAPIPKKIGWIFALPCKWEGKCNSIPDSLTNREIMNSRKHGYCQASKKGRTRRLANEQDGGTERRRKYSLQDI